MGNCIFCKIVTGEISSNKIWENERFLAFLDIKPIELGHTLVIPKNHVDSVFDLPDEDYSELFVIARYLEKPIKQGARSLRVGLVVEGFGVSHTHLHLVPINKPNQLGQERAHGVPEEALASMQEKIKKFLP